MTNVKKTMQKGVESMKPPAYETNSSATAQKFDKTKNEKMCNRLSGQSVSTKTKRQVSMQKSSTIDVKNTRNITQTITPKKTPKIISTKNNEGGDSVGPINLSRRKLSANEISPKERDARKIYLDTGNLRRESSLKKKRSSIQLQKSHLTENSVKKELRRIETENKRLAAIVKASQSILKARVKLWQECNRLAAVTELCRKQAATTLESSPTLKKLEIRLKKRRSVAFAQCKQGLRLSLRNLEKLCRLIRLKRNDKLVQNRLTLLKKHKNNMIKQIKRPSKPVAAKSSSTQSPPSSSPASSSSERVCELTKLRLQEDYPHYHHQQQQAKRGHRQSSRRHNKNPAVAVGLNETSSCEKEENDFQVDQPGHLPTTCSTTMSKFQFRLNPETNNEKYVFIMTDEMSGDLKLGNQQNYGHRHHHQHHQHPGHSSSRNRLRDDEKSIVGSHSLFSEAPRQTGVQITEIPTSR